MNFYKAENVKSHVAISQYLKDQGVKVTGNRAVAAWRNGQRESVSIDDTKGVWHDFVADEGGDIIALCVKIEGGSFLSACRTLGDRYHLEPDKTSRKPKQTTRGEMLVADGFRLVRSYEYKSEDGSPRYWVDRYERINADGEREKEFVQRGPNAENLHGIKKTIYNLPAVIAATRVFVVEGEKDADTLINKFGLTATTNSGGAKNWEPDFSRYFEAKDVVILPDNDDAGRKHADLVASAILPFAKSVRVVNLSKLPKGDVTDWIEQEGGTISALTEAVAAASAPAVCTPEVAAAKMANNEPLRNYTEDEPEEGQKPKRHPRLVDDICEEMSTRFLGFPKRIGGALFDYTRGRDRKILYLLDQDSLRAWVNGTSHHQSDFQHGGAFASYKEVMSRLLQTRPCYDVIAHAPWYPVRDDAFAAYDALPNPDASHSKLDELMAFFLPASEADATLMRAFFMAPMFFTDGARPSWIVDTVDAQASGKTTVVKACAWIYNEQPIDIDLKTLDGDLTQVKKRLLSAEGRGKRIALFDNVTSSLRSGNLANLITAQSITGMAPYGRGEETRRNDVTWCATVNNASVDTDMATRSYVIRIKSPDPDADPMWEKRLREFIEANRPQIHADMMDLMRSAPPRRRKKSRFGEFDAVVLSAACATDAQFHAADDAIRAAAESANDDADLAAQCVEAITNALLKYEDATHPIRTELPCVLRCSDVDEILRRTSGGVRNWTSKIVRRFVNSGNIKNIVKGVERVNTADGRRHFGKARCFIFSPCEQLLANATSAQFVTFDGGKPTVLGVGNV